jgi:hypothetical protein
MSLLQRVTSIDGFDRAPPHVDSTDLGYGTAASLRRVISYDVFPKPAEDSQATFPTHGVAQYKISAVRRFGKPDPRIVFRLLHANRSHPIAQVAITIVSCWLASGIVYGFAALKPVLVDQGVYRELCSQEELDANVELCYEQDLRYISVAPECV